ncbi:hypothetical protein HMPREF1078_03048 [Parabacteroides merdae CL09T00C40]|nr:hypothetical protein HMPREF1078_03048 [Parabacteroides merdae CL09T00C40]CDD14182.1 uncharacterized protein BN675_02565 [Parabacteroides merdae CAG:48]CUP24292.1 NigD-like protein [Parabacteroides merdae]SUV31694.1 NigD-like protein [Parabacteroides merdae]
MSYKPFFRTFVRFLHKERKINTTSNLYMEMRKTVLYGVLAFCLVVLNSCLGDPATQLTMANQAGVVVTGYGPGKAIYTKGDVVVSSEDFQNANVENGECILFDYSIDYGVANNMGAGTDTSYTEAIIYENTISEVNRWNFYNTLTDTSIVAKDELLLSSLQARSAYIRGNLFLFTEISNHPANQVDSFSLSYNSDKLLGDDNIYSLYLRTIRIKADTTRGEAMIIPCAFNIEDLVKKAEKNHSDELKFRINYAYSFGKDSASINWKSSDVFTIDLTGKGK